MLFQTMSKLKVPWTQFWQDPRVGGGMVFSSNTCACFEAAAAHTQQTDSDDIDLRWQTSKQRPVLLHIHSFSQRAFLLDRLQSILQIQ